MTDNHQTTERLEWDGNNLWAFGKWVGIEVGKVTALKNGNWRYKMSGGAALGSIGTESEARRALFDAVCKVMS